jgi:exosome complex component CSL4
MSEGTFVIPGQRICEISSTLIAGSGTYLLNGGVIASLAGTISVQEEQNSLRRLTVVPGNSHNSTELVISVDDVVIAHVVRIQANQALVDIVAVNENVLKQHARGTIRREDVRPSDVDSLIMHQCFRAGDIVRAVVISLGDARHYVLSTSKDEFGVLWAKCEETGNVMVPKSLMVKFITSPSFTTFSRVLTLRSLC